MFWYSCEWLDMLYTTLGNTGRAFYFQMLIVDLSYILFTGLGLACLLYNLSVNTRWTWLSYVPVFAALMDLMENACQMLLLHNFPELNYFLVLTSSLFTLFKMVLMIVTLLSILIFTVKILSRKLILISKAGIIKK